MASLDVKAPAAEKKEAPKKVKLDQADVDLLVRGSMAACAVRVWSSDANWSKQVQELEISKTKARDLLGESGGDAVKALTAYITAPA